MVRLGEWRPRAAGARRGGWLGSYHEDTGGTHKTPASWPSWRSCRCSRREVTHCGSGTTAYVAEQWGRRWITCDTSRVAIPTLVRGCTPRVHTRMPMARPGAYHRPRARHHWPAAGEGSRQGKRCTAWASTFRCLRLRLRPARRRRGEMLRQADRADPPR